MSLKLVRLSLCLLFFSSLACKNSSDSNAVKKEIDPMQAALPHGDTLPEDNLNESDRQKIADAIGRTTDTLSVDSLIYVIENSSKRLHAYAFWKLDCKACQKQNQLLRKLQNEIGNENLQVTFVNLDPLSKASEVNASIRVQSISEPVYMISDYTISELSPKLRRIATTTLPSLLFVNKDYHTYVHYNQKFEYDELYAMVQPLLM